MLLLDRLKMAAGSISLGEFYDLAMKFAKFSSMIDDTWIVKRPSRDADKEIFLEKCMTVKMKDNCGTSLATTVEGDGCQTFLEDEMLEEPDTSCFQARPTSGDHFLSCQYHVVYSHSYSVPVLYFNICKIDGKRLTLEELWNRVPATYQQRIEHHKWATLTQQEHPHLGSPFFMLHPCHTASLMSQVPKASDQRYYLVKWLSSVGPVVGLEMSPAYASAFDEHKHGHSSKNDIPCASKSDT